MARRILARLKGICLTTLQVTPAAIALVVLSNDLDGSAFLIMLGIFTLLATGLAAALACYEREVLRPPARRMWRLRLFT